MIKKKRNSKVGFEYYISFVLIRLYLKTKINPKTYFGRRLYTE